MFGCTCPLFTLRILFQDERYYGQDKASITRRRHQVETFAALLALCAGNSPVTGEFPTQRPVMRSFDVFYDPRLNNGWVINSEAGDLRRNRAHYGVIVMIYAYALALCIGEAKSSVYIRVWIQTRLPVS